MTVLHEILAVEGKTEGVSKKLVDESIKTFGKPSIFSGSIKTSKMFNDAEQHLAPPTEDIKVESTVDENLDYIKTYVSEYWDVVLQKDDANTRAKADLIIDGKTIASQLPATFLLGLETKLNELRKVYESIPTLQSGRYWEIDPTQRAGIFRDKNATDTFRTVKVVKPVVLYEATDKHPAQVKEVSEDVKVGKTTGVDYSGMISAADKAARIARLDKVLKAVKQARMRANEATVNTDLKVGEILFTFINQG